MSISTNKYHLRDIRTEDNQRVKDIIIEVMTSFGCIGEGYSSSDAELEDMTSAYAGEDAHFYVIVDQDDQIWGCGGIAALAGSTGRVCELRKMYFLEALRGHGWGQKMIDACIAIAKDKGYSHMYLETIHAMEAANHLYKKNGFELLEGAKGDTGHSSCDAWRIKEL